MKRILLFVLCMMVLMPQLHAAGSVGFGLQATGASINFAKPLDEIYKQGFGGGAHLDISFVPLVGGIRLWGDYIVFSPDNDKYKALFAAGNPGAVASAFSIEGGQVNILAFGLNAKFGLPTPVLSAYVTGGAGAASVGMSEMKVAYQGGPAQKFEGVKSETKFAANAGGGVELKIGVTLYLEAKYTWIFTEGEKSTYIPVSLGITF